MQCLIIMVIVSATNCKMKIKKDRKNLCFLRGWAEQTFLPRCKNLFNPYVFYLQNLQFQPDQRGPAQHLQFMLVAVCCVLNICSFVQQGMLQFVHSDAQWWNNSEFILRRCRLGECVADNYLALPCRRRKLNERPRCKNPPVREDSYSPNPRRRQDSQVVAAAGWLY